MPARQLERLALPIMPGGWAVESERPISTVLGSCVAVCLYDPVLHLGGMNHFMLPSRARSQHDEDVTLAGDHAMEVLVNAMMARGARKNRLIAKAFGGGTVVSAIRSAIGQRNAEFAREWLAREGIALQAMDFLGPWSRKVIFAPSTGDAYCRRMASPQHDAERLAQLERDYEASLLNKPSGGVELF